MIEEITIWVDGSYANTARGPAMGAGWAVQDRRGEIRDYALPITQIMSGSSSTIAEILSAAYALHLLPPAEAVILYSDCELVCATLNGRPLPAWVETSEAKSAQSLYTALTKLIEAAAIHTAIEAKILEKDDPMSPRVHGLAVGAMSQVASYRITPNPAPAAAP